MSRLKTIFFGLAFGLLWLPLTVHGLTKVSATTPVVLTIPKIAVKATIEPRGLNARKIMRPPSSGQTVAWYNQGAIPGQPGEAVIYGHLTGQHFEPTVFARLNKLKRNDRISVMDNRGTIRTFKVTKLDTFRADSLTFSQLSNPTSFIHLNLYTCAGHWDRQLHHYSDYLVVYTSLLSVAPRK